MPNISTNPADYDSLEEVLSQIQQQSNSIDNVIKRIAGEAADKRGVDFTDTCNQLWDELENYTQRLSSKDREHLPLELNNQ